MIVKRRGTKMTKYMIVARPVRWSGLKYTELVDDESGEWHEKARALQVRRWRALKRASKNKQEQSLIAKVK
jgi:hypothetical protein